MEISKCNYLLMKAKAKQCSTEKIKKAREDKTSSISLDDDGIFSDDEGGYAHTSAIHQASILSTVFCLSTIHVTDISYGIC